MCMCWQEDAQGCSVCVCVSSFSYKYFTVSSQKGEGNLILAVGFRGGMKNTQYVCSFKNA